MLCCVDGNYWKIKYIYRINTQRDDFIQLLNIPVIYVLCLYYNPNIMAHHL